MTMHRNRNLVPLVGVVDRFGIFRISLISMPVNMQYFVFSGGVVGGFHSECFGIVCDEMHLSCRTIAYCFFLTVDARVSGKIC